MSATIEGRLIAEAKAHVDDVLGDSGHLDDRGVAYEVGHAVDKLIGYCERLEMRIAQLEAKQGGGAT